MTQTILTAENHYAGLDGWLRDHDVKTVLLVCDESLGFLTGITEKLNDIESKPVTVVRFSDFKPNPAYESVVAGVRLFRESGCQAIMAIGGGSAMDVAKCIKLYSNMDSDGADGAFLHLPIIPNAIPFLAMPTTAGTGSEATRYAVIYFGGKKQSVTHDSCIPETVLMDAGTLKTLPLYQKKATMCDALCHAIESIWSVNSTDESRAYAKAAIEGVLTNVDGYLAGDEGGNAGMLMAAHLAGKAINITQTTAGHAMCYKLTSLFRIAHGHAAMLCDRVLYPWMIDHTDRCTDPRGAAHLRAALDAIGQTMGGRDARDGAEKLTALFARLDLPVPQATAEQIAELTTGVNPDRLKNHPIALDETTIRDLYHHILR